MQIHDLKDGQRDRLRSVHAAGTANLGSGRAGTIAFPGGTIKLSHHAGKGTMRFSPKTCLTMISQPGTYKITGGTGKYAGITGHGTYQLSLTFIAARAQQASAPQRRRQSPSRNCSACPGRCTCNSACLHSALNRTRQEMGSGPCQLS